MMPDATDFLQEQDRTSHIDNDLTALGYVGEAVCDGSRWTGPLPRR
jgi:hypothetical protein